MFSNLCCKLLMGANGSVLSRQHRRGQLRRGQLRRGELRRGELRRGEHL